MTCRELIDFLMSYVDDELGPGERSHFDRHLAACPHCRSYLASYLETVKLGRMICRDDESAPPPDVPEDLVAAILEARRAEG